MAGFCDPDRLHPETRLKADLNLDSLEIVQLVLGLNRVFGLELHSEDITPENFDSLATLAALIARKQTNQTPNG
jgi:acyl carrier protein